MSKQSDLKNLFLSDEMLIELAMRELRGKRPPVQKAQSDAHIMTNRIKTKLQRELESRGWTYRDLAENIGVPAAEAQALARGGQRMTRELAQKLGQVFATSSDYWLRDDD